MNRRLARLLALVLLLGAAGCNSAADLPSAEPPPASARPAGESGKPAGKNFQNAVSEDSALQ